LSVCRRDPTVCYAYADADSLTPSLARLSLASRGAKAATERWSFMPQSATVAARSGSSVDVCGRSPPRDGCADALVC